MWDKMKALELRAKIESMLVEKVEHSGSVNLANALNEARRRVKNSGLDDPPDGET